MTDPKHKDFYLSDDDERLLNNKDYSDSKFSDKEYKDYFEEGKYSGSNNDSDADFSSDLDMSDNKPE